VADTELRPAYDRLVRALGDTGKAQDALSLALDVSAGSGKSLEAVTDAMGKAYEGNIAGLSRLGAGIDAATIKTGDMQVITQVLSDTFSGQATASADTLQGRMRVLKTATDNLAEAFGKGLLTGLTDATEGTSDMVKSMEKLEPALEDLGETVADVVASLAMLYDGFIFLRDIEKKVKTETGLLGDAFSFVSDTINPFSRVMNALAQATEETGDAALISADKLLVFANAAKKTADGLPYFLGGLREVEKATNEQTAANVKATYGVLTLAERQAAYEKILEGTEDTIRSYGGSTGSATVEVEKLTKFQKFLEKARKT